MKTAQMPTKPVPAKGGDGRFLSGNIGGGRPKGSRNKLSDAFLDALCSDFEAHGAKVIEQVRLEDPAAYLRTVASLTPRKVEMEAIGDGNSLSDAQLEAIIYRAREEEDAPVTPKAPRRGSVDSGYSDNARAEPPTRSAISQGRSANRNRIDR